MSFAFVIDFVIQTLRPINFTIRPTLTSDPHSSVHGYAQEHTSIYIYIYTSVDPCISMHGAKVESYVKVGLMVKLIGRKV